MVNDTSLPGWELLRNFSKSGGKKSKRLFFLLLLFYLLLPLLFASFPRFLFYGCGPVSLAEESLLKKYGALRLTEVLPWSDASSGHWRKMFRDWTQFAPLRPLAEPLNWNSVSLTHLALWIIALGFVAGSEPSDVGSVHHIHLPHGNKRHHTMPLAIHRSPASLRAGHSKYFLFNTFTNDTSSFHTFPENACKLDLRYNFLYLFPSMTTGFNPCCFLSQQSPSP